MSDRYEIALQAYSRAVKAFEHHVFESCDFCRMKYNEFLEREGSAMLYEEGIERCEDGRLLLVKANELNEHRWAAIDEDTIDPDSDSDRHAS